jgi:hypothetical protein
VGGGAAGLWAEAGVPPADVEGSADGVAAADWEEEGVTTADVVGRAVSVTDMLALADADGLPVDEEVEFCCAVGTTRLRGGREGRRK